jgi:ectoine hydroxylase-related dioxygenase (phytanoyl-CoA dioxygenase family)
MLSDNERETFEKNGFVLLSTPLSSEMVNDLKASLSIPPSPQTGSVTESDGLTLRAVHLCYLDTPNYADLARRSELLLSAQAILGPSVYVYQFKINMKAAFTGEAWPWHDDFVFWNTEDGMPQPHAVTAAIFLDDVTEINGPICFIPKSHRHQSQAQCVATEDSEDETWRSHVSANLKYQTNREIVSVLARQDGVAVAKGQAGSILFFHCKVVHASAANISPFDRRILLITYNRVDNQPTRLERPNFLVNRDASPLSVLESP